MSDRFLGSFLLISTVLHTAEKSDCLLLFPSLPSQRHQGEFLHCLTTSTSDGVALQWGVPEGIRKKPAQAYEMVLVHQHKRYCSNVSWYLFFNHIFRFSRWTSRLRKICKQIMFSFDMVQPVSSPYKPFCNSTVEFCLFVRWTKQIWAVSQSISVYHETQEKTL